jgi:hypothetical protein
MAEKPFRLRSFMGQVMRVSDDMRRCVVFLGNKDDSAPGGIACFGTAFLVAYKGHRYLVTAQHIAVGIGDAPYLIRLNKLDGSSQNIAVDPRADKMRWLVNTNDPDVDLAVLPFEYDWRAAGYDAYLVPEHGLASDEIIKSNGIGIGDVCYTIGLFRLLSGAKRNLPMVHAGTIAMMPSDEKIPVQNWLMPNTRRYIEAYVIEAQSLKGLSGSPCFVEPTIDLVDMPTDSGGTVNARFGRADLRLLGVWQGSWDAQPDEVLAVEQGNTLRVPVGLGVVVPTQRLIDLLELPEAQAQRQANRDRLERERQAKPDGS